VPCVKNGAHLAVQKSLLGDGSKLIFGTEAFFVFEEVIIE
jgi:hypothetical protein